MKGVSALAVFAVMVVVLAFAVGIANFASVSQYGQPIIGGVTGGGSTSQSQPADKVGISGSAALSTPLIGGCAVPPSCLSQTTQTACQNTPGCSWQCTTSGTTSSSPTGGGGTESRAEGQYPNAINFQTSSCSCGGTSSSSCLTTSAGTASSIVTILGPVTVKSSNPEDYIISHSQECAILTNIVLNSSAASQTLQTSSAFAQEKVWVEMDGKPIPVSSDDTTNPGQVVFCERAYQVSTNVLNQIQYLCGSINNMIAVLNQNINNVNFIINYLNLTQNLTSTSTLTNITCDPSVFSSYINSKDAHSFNWITLNVGSGTHTFVVKAQLTVDTNLESGNAATVLIGKRTLVVWPTKLANNIAV